jgi:hypothetical protein
VAILLASSAERSLVITDSAAPPRRPEAVRWGECDLVRFSDVELSGQSQILNLDEIILGTEELSILSPILKRTERTDWTGRLS